jgi:hypothetical protein
VTNDLKTIINEMSGTTVAAKLRGLMPDIDRKIKEGVTHQEMVQALRRAGLEITLGNFRMNLYRYRQKLKDGQPAAPEVEETGNLFPASTNLIQTAISAGSQGSEPDFEAALDPKQQEAANSKFFATKKPIIGNKRN